MKDKIFALTKCFILSLITTSCSILLIMFLAAKSIQYFNILFPTEYLVYALGFASLSLIGLFIFLFLFFVKRKYIQYLHDAKLFIYTIVILYLGMFVFNVIEVFKTNHIIF